MLQVLSQNTIGVSLRGGPAGEPGRGLVYRGLWRRAPLSIGDPLRSMGRVRLPGTLRAGVHAPTKSVSVPAAIPVVLIFHVSLWPGSTRGRHDKVIGTTTDMSA